jgi:hypothetical protein
MDSRPIKDWTNLNSSCSIVQTSKLSLLGCSDRLAVRNKVTQTAAIDMGDAKITPAVIGTFAYDDADSFLI